MELEIQKNLKIHFKKYKFKISKKFIFPDHHNFKNEDLDKIKKIALNNKLEIITTEKDYKRLN